MPLNTQPPRVSVIMANLNGAAHIAAAIRSVLRQTENSIELIVSDDGSTDDSLDRARAAAGADPRLIIVTGGGRSGPAATRNRALDRARGDWIAIVDNDDFIHSERLERLIKAAETDGADIVADDLLVFYDTLDKPPHPHLRGALTKRPHWIDAAAYERSNRLLGPGPSLGYLKPVFRRALGPHYNENLRIGEDSELVLRLLMAGARMRLYPDLGYFYRKHEGSISHRLDLAAIEALESAYAALPAISDAPLRRALAQGASARADARVFTNLINALKARRFGDAMRAALVRPGALALLREPLRARLFPVRIRARRPASERVTLISRQRIVGSTNGSSAYVLALAGALRDAGYNVDYIGASPKIFGRWAGLKLRPETEVFARYVMPGAVRIGGTIITLNPRVWLASALAATDYALRRLGIAAANLSKPAEYAQGAQATRADQIFIARHAAAGAKAVLCDYAFTGGLAPFALAPDAPSLTIMHDLMSARISDRAVEQTPDEVNQLTAEQEFRLLGLTDAVIAIQHEEAARVREALPERVVITAPHSIATVRAPQPGKDDTLLFVGSNTAPNIVGLKWFFDGAWPEIRRQRPQARLLVAGSVARALERTPEGVELLGVVKDLTPLYREAGVVISPLYTGSGLKIKLIEALAAGKAVTATPVTVQGVEDQVRGAVAMAETPQDFATQIIALLGNHDARTQLAAEALRRAQRFFSADACFEDMIAFVRDRATPHLGQKPLQAVRTSSQ